MKIRNALLVSASAASLVAATSTAEAASTYVSVFGGASLLQKPGLKGISHTHTTTTSTFVSKTSLDTSFKTGFVVGGNWGVDWGNFRTELEAAYHSNSSNKTGHLVTSYQSGPIGGALTSTIATRDSIVPTDVTLHAYSLMANVWYDFHGFSAMGITPYIGAGVGLAQVQIGGRVNGINLIEKNDYTFAWQVGAGASVPVSQDMNLFVDYRYFAADGAKLELRPGFHGGGINADFDANEVLLGLRIKI